MNLHQDNNGYPVKYNPILDESSFSGQSPELELEKRKAINELKEIGDFVQGGGSGGFGSGRIDSSNNTLAITIQNNTTAVQQASLFQFSESLFTGVQNPPPSILSPLIPLFTFSAPDFAFCPINNFIYCAGSASDTVDIVDCNTNTLLTSVIFPVGWQPASITYNSISNEMYVGSGGFNQVLRIDCVNNIIVGVPIIIANPVQIQSMVYNSIKNSVYIYDVLLGTLEEIDCFTNLVVFSIIAPGFYIFATFNPQNNRLYFSDNIFENIDVLDCALNLFVSSTPSTLLGTRGSSIVPSINTLYVVGSFTNDFIRFDIGTNTIIGVAIPLGVGVPVSIVYNSLNDILYTAGAATDTLVEIDPNTNLVSVPILLPGSVPLKLLYNSNINSCYFTYTGSGALSSLFPAIPPTPVITYSGGITPAVIYNDTQTKPFIIRGLKMIVSDISQLGNNLKVGNRSYTGAVDNLQWQPLNYVSPSTRFTGIIDAPDFEFDVDRGPDSATIDFDVNPLSKVTVIFSIGDSLDSSVLTNDKPSRIEKSKVIRKTGNPIFDLIQENDSKAKKEGESDFNPIEFANYPILVGNPIADITILRDSGIQGI
jgi:hypothetical protein